MLLGLTNSLGGCVERRGTLRAFDIIHGRLLLYDDFLAIPTLPDQLLLLKEARVHRHGSLPPHHIICMFLLYSHVHIRRYFAGEPTGGHHGGEGQIGR